MREALDAHALIRDQRGQSTIGRVSKSGVRRKI